MSQKQIFYLIKIELKIKLKIEKIEKEQKIDNGVDCVRTRFQVR